MTPDRKAAPDRRGRQRPERASGGLRLFYAVKVPPEVAAELAQAQAQLRGNWRRVDPAQLHITLAYLPGVAPQQLDALKRLGAQAAQACPPLDLSLRGTGYFPNEGSPRVWFVKVADGGGSGGDGSMAEAPAPATSPLEQLAADLRAGAEALGLSLDDKAFKAHVTLARKKGPAPRVPPLVFEDLGWQARHVSLVRSTLRKTGPIYQTVSRFELRGHPGGAAPGTPPDAGAPAFLSTHPDPAAPAQENP